jgi:hypothetical protein
MQGPRAGGECLQIDPQEAAELNRALYACSCVAGYRGFNCADDINECVEVGDQSSTTPYVGNPCQNGGACTQSVDGYACTCLSGFTGVDPGCEVDIDECAVDPCHSHGQCRQTSTDAYLCICSEGWAGENCEENIDTCISTPETFGRAAVSPCAELCAEPELHPDDCVDTASTCIDHEGDQGYTCDCSSGHEGASAGYNMTLYDIPCCCHDPL